MSGRLYLYGFVAPATDAAGAPTGIDGGTVRVLDLGAVHAVVSEVDPDTFDPERIEARLQDLDWVGAVGAAHEGVVTWFVDHSGILPARLLTLWSGADALAAEVSPRAPALAERLEGLRDLREWDLKVSYDPRRLAPHLAELSEEVAALDAEIQEAPPGRRYLLDRKRAKLVEVESARAARDRARGHLEELAACARELRVLPLSRNVEDGRVVLNAALLVSREADPELARRARVGGEALEAIGLDARLTGPWAPYRFLEDDVDGAP